MKWLKENFTSLVKICVLVIAFLMPITLLFFIWINYFRSYNHINDLITALESTTQQNIDLSNITQYFDSNLQFSFNIFISIIDIAIAVWLGLNIYNILSKNQITKLEEELTNTLATVRKEHINTLNILNEKIECVDMKVFKLDKAFLITSEKDLYRKVQYCQELIDKDPESRENYNLLGNQYYVSHDYKNALQNYERAIEVSKEYYLEAEFNCCECLINLGLYEDAILRLEKILEYNRSDFEVYLIIAEAYRRKGDYADAIKYNQKAEQLSDENYYVLNMYGSIYFDMGQSNDAEKYFKQTLSKMPDLEEAHYYLAEIYKNTDPTQSQHHRDLAHGYVPDKP